MIWNSASAFWLLIPLFLLTGLFLIKGSKNTPSVRFSQTVMLAAVTKTLRARFVNLPFFLQVLALGLAIIALARPQRADVRVKRNVEGIDIMLALDVSDSMLIEDMKPENRLESAKKTIRDFVDGRVSDRIGLVVFSGESYTRVPLTLDYPILQDSLAKVKTSRNIKMGTAIGVALANAVARLKDSTAKTRTVILLTDGENNSGTIDPETALVIAKGYGIRIYTIGVGRDGQAQLPIIRQIRPGKTVKSYQPIHSKVNVKLLKRLALQTGGKFYRAINSNALKEVFSDINELEKTKIEVNQYTRYAELFPPYLEWAFWLYLLHLLLAKTVFRRQP